MDNIFVPYANNIISKLRIVFTVNIQGFLQVFISASVLVNNNLSIIQRSGEDPLYVGITCVRSICYKVNNNISLI